MFSSYPSEVHIVLCYLIDVTLLVAQRVGQAQNETKVSVPKSHGLARFNINGRYRPFSSLLPRRRIPRTYPWNKAQKIARRLGPVYGSDEVTCHVAFRFRPSNKAKERARRYCNQAFLGLPALAFIFVNSIVNSNPSKLVRYWSSAKTYFSIVFT